MCDEFTARDEEAALTARGLDRRQFAAISAAAVIAGCTGGESQARGGKLTEAMVTVDTPDGKADAFFVHPASGRHPGVILWPDIAGLRDAYKTMARRLAAAGYAVLAVNQYYRSAPAPVLPSFAEWRTPEGQAKLRPMIAAINPAATTSDAGAFVRWLDAQRAVDTRRKIGTNGYCMGGPFTVRTAAAAPGRVGAAASFHGAALVTPGADSPHLLLAATRARYLFAIARNDDARSPADKSVLQDTARVAGRTAEVEVYPADHGWCTLDAPSYDQVQADRAWGRMLELFKGL
ncbi:MAG: dienelactone hydrolase family protein [Sphingomonadales bacterium]|nr:dienelactone hydrolase family protein [Sphingomonadales bacterium]